MSGHSRRRLPSTPAPRCYRHRQVASRAYSSRAPPQNITGFAPYLPSNAGGALWGSPLGTAHALSPWTGFAVLCGYAAVLVGLAAWRLRRRDVVRTIRPHRA